MNPPDTYAIRHGMSAYADNQFPDTDDCVTLDKQIADIGKDIIAMDFRIINNVGGWLKNPYNKAYRKVLVHKQGEKREKFEKIDCRNRIEVKRHDESASTFNQYASTADKQVLEVNNKKQIAYVLIGSVIVLLAVAIVVKR